MSAKVEARSNLDGIGLVKLMGRQSGFIAMQVVDHDLAWHVIHLAPHRPPCLLAWWTCA